MNTFLIVFLGSLTFLGGKTALFQEDGASASGNDRNPRTEQIDLSEYTTVRYVSSTKTDNREEGTRKYPFSTVRKALQSINIATPHEKAAILVGEGVYKETTIHLKVNVHMFGGFNATTWKRDIMDFESILAGVEGQRVIVAEDNVTIDGFTITGAKFRGKGAAIYLDGTSPVITNNIFKDNRTLKPQNWNPEYWHETAHDGGAVYGKEGASPVIKHNIFAYNKTENGRGAAVAFDGHCDPQIRENVFYNNHSGLDDPMRSSDGSAISLFRWCKGVIEGNLFLSNHADAKNDGGAVFTALWSSPTIKENIFVDNTGGDDGGALFVGGQEHRYDEPLDPFPPADEFYVTVDNNVFMGNRNSSMNSGALRFTMESRGAFTNNIVAHNNGIYFQRSESRITGNVILDNMLVIETKEYLNKSVIKNNIIWADFEVDQTVAEVTDNYLLEKTEVNKNNKYYFPGFAEDRLVVPVLSAYYLSNEYYSELVVANGGQITGKDLSDRIVNSNERWGVIKSYKNNVLQVWGDFSSVTSLIVLPTYAPMGEKILQSEKR